MAESDIDLLAVWIDRMPNTERWIEEGKSARFITILASRMRFAG